MYVLRGISETELGMLEGDFSTCASSVGAADDKFAYFSDCRQMPWQPGCSASAEVGASTPLGKCLVDSILLSAAQAGKAPGKDACARVAIFELTSTAFRVYMKVNPNRSFRAGFPRRITQAALRKLWGSGQASLFGYIEVPGVCAEAKLSEILALACAFAPSGHEDAIRKIGKVDEKCIEEAIALAEDRAKCARLWMSHVAKPLREAISGHKMSYSVPLSEGLEALDYKVVDSGAPGSLDLEFRCAGALTDAAPSGYASIGTNPAPKPASATPPGVFLGNTQVKAEGANLCSLCTGLLNIGSYEARYHEDTGAVRVSARILDAGECPHQTQDALGMLVASDKLAACMGTNPKVDIVLDGPMGACARRMWDAWADEMQDDIRLGAGSFRIGGRAHERFVAPVRTGEKKITRCLLEFAEAQLLGDATLSAAYVIGNRPSLQRVRFTMPDGIDMRKTALSFVSTGPTRLLRIGITGRFEGANVSVLFYPNARVSSIIVPTRMVSQATEALLPYLPPSSRRIPDVARTGRICTVKRGDPCSAQRTTVL